MLDIAKQLALKMTKSNVPSCFEAQPKTLAFFLPYEQVVKGERPLFILSDGAVGVFWELSAIAHEAMEISELSRKLELFSKTFLAQSHLDISFQMIFDSAPCPEIPKPSWFQTPITFEQRVLKGRFLEIEKQTVGRGSDALMLMKRRLYLTLRIALPGDKKAQDTHLSAELELQDAHLSQLEVEAKTLATEMENNLERAGISFRICAEDDLQKLVKPMLHSEVAQSAKHFYRKMTDERLSESFADDFVTLVPDKIKTDLDSWQVLSFKEAPQDVFDGMMVRLLNIKTPMRVVVNMRPSDATDDLTKKEYFLRNARDAFSERQQGDVQKTLEKLAYGEKILGVSVHILARHKECDPNKFVFDSMRRTLENTLDVPLISERFSAPLIFWSCLPFGFNAVMASLICRERRLLSSRAMALLPMYCGFKGTGDKLKTQILQNRAGEAAFLSMRASDTAAHLAVLAGSGSGKSFFTANLLTAERATNPSSLTFIIDNKTSYEILATAFGQKGGFTIVKPPQSFPNLFKGELDDEGERLRSIVNVLKAAITLSSNEESVDAIKANLLALAVRKTFEDATLDASTGFDTASQMLTEKYSARRTVPKLSEVVDNLVTVCEQNGFESTHAKWIRDKLSPFYGKGPYAELFDREESISFENPTPSISLYDLDGVSGDKTLATLTTLIIISDVVRQVKRKENRGRGGQLVIEEAGVLGSGSKELVSFCEDSWKTFRKLGFMCIGLTNQVSDYKSKPGPQTIWAVSPNKIVLRMSQSEVDDAFKETKENPALLRGELTKALVGSLVKKDGVYSQGLFTSQEVTGTFHYQPTGFDYYLAASKPEEVETVHELARALCGNANAYEQALSYLAKHFPRGVRNPDTNQIRYLTQEEISDIADSILKEVLDE